jgi:putative Mn2+ efflux pump MntP
MPVLGLLLGHQLSGTLGAQAHLVGGGGLAAVGVYTIVQAIRSADEAPSTLKDASLGRLLWLGAGLSIDNLLSVHAGNLPLTAHRSPLALGIVLVCVGAAIAAQLF